MPTTQCFLSFSTLLIEGGDSLKLADFGLAMSMSEKAEEENTDEVSVRILCGLLFVCVYCPWKTLWCRNCYFPIFVSKVCVCRIPLTTHYLITLLCTTHPFPHHSRIIILIILSFVNTCTRPARLTTLRPR